MTTRLLRASLLASFVLVSAGCADGEPPGAGPDEPTGVSVSPGEPTEDPTPLEVAPRAGLVEARPRPWEDVEVVAPRRLRVLFWSGVEECYGLDRVDVEESPQSVTITLIEGRVPEAEVCIEIAVQKVVEVRLEAPLGDRNLVDGAAEDR